jgi:hypothetical protein
VFQVEVKDGEVKDGEVKDGEVTEHSDFACSPNWEMCSLCSQCAIRPSRFLGMCVYSVFFFFVFSV